jgi:hypothetical protein
MLERMIRRSRVRLGKSRFAGLPAVFIGIAVLVSAAGAAVALVKAAESLPNVLRETRQLWLAVTGQRRNNLEPWDPRRGTTPAEANPLGR